MSWFPPIARKPVKVVYAEDPRPGMSPMAPEGMHATPQDEDLRAIRLALETIVQMLAVKWPEVARELERPVSDEPPVQTSAGASDALLAWAEEARAYMRGQSGREDVSDDDVLTWLRENGPREIQEELK